MVDRQRLTEKLKEVERQIEELEKRIPPHSVQPHLIRQLDELEARRDDILEQLQKMK